MDAFLSFGSSCGSTLHVVEHVVCLILLIRSCVFLWRLGLTGTVKMVMSTAISSARVMPGLGGVVDAQIGKEVAALEKKMLGDGDPDANTGLPEQGLPKTEILQYVSRRKAEEQFSTGRKWAGIYHDVTGESELEGLQTDLWSLYNNSNALYPGVFPSIRKYEAEIVSMAVDLLHGTQNGAVGLLTSGGTESILVAMWSYKQLAVEQGISAPEVICSRSAHPALDKACHYFGMKLVKINPDPVSLRLSPVAVSKAITNNTVAVYASAPSFPHGTVDPIEDLAAVTRPLKIGLHVDNCLGGFYLSFLQREGLFKKRFDFQVEGVTTISIDIHKYGYAPKGSSVVAFASNDLRRRTYCPVTDGLTMYITPTMQGSRSGAQITAAWGTMVHMGAKGYAAAARRLNDMKIRIEKEVEKIPGIRMLCDADLAIVPLASDDFDIFAVATLMEKRGWNVFTSKDPSTMGLCLGEQHTRVLDDWLSDLRECVEYLQNNPGLKVEVPARKCLMYCQVFEHYA